jgi:hypothetical protein
MDYIWDLRNPDGAMVGVEWARGRSEACQVILAHSLPRTIDVEVRDDDGRIVAMSAGLTADRETPMARLEIVHGEVTRTAVWPAARDVGRLVILPGGEIGTLLEWWNAPDESEWRWKVEFHNSA